jgi:hypothetical protein
MPAQVKTYKPSDLKLILAGSYQVGGIVSISLTFPERYKLIKGIKGQHTRVRNQDTSCVISVELLQTSVSNDVLSEITSQDILTGSGRLSLSVQDVAGTSRFETSNAFIIGYPETNYSTELSTRTWTFQMLDTNFVLVGGNTNKRPQFLEDIAGFLGAGADKIAQLGQSAVNTVSSALGF